MLKDDDDGLRDRFHTLASEQTSHAPELSHSQIDAWRSSLRLRQRGTPSSAVRFAAAGASLAGAAIALTVGLVWGANTGYASARVEGDRQRHELAASTMGVGTQVAALRVDLARARTELAGRAARGEALSRASMLATVASLQSMEASAERIELDLARSQSQAAVRPAGASNVPIKRALAITCSALALNPPATPSAPAQQGIPIVELSSAAAKTTTTLGAVLGVRELSDGRVLVNDAGRRQIKVFDSTLASATVALDSVAGSSNSYPTRAANIVRYLGDSTLVTEVASRSVVVLDRGGQVARALAPPTFEDGVTPFPAPFPNPSAMDDKGRLLAKGPTRIRGGKVADSTLILRADLDSRQVDVVGAIYAAGSQLRDDPPQDGKRVVTSTIQPVPTEDAWAVLSDGTIALVRGRDYHVDWVLPDGSKSATTKLPYDWKRLTDEDKQKLVDSARVVWDSLMTVRNKRVAGPPPTGPDGNPGRGRSGGGAADPASGQQGSIQRIEFVPLSEIPDYYPPIRRNSAIPDLDGNLWILPTTSAQSKQGELVYDVVNPKKGLFQRVRMPLGRSIAGFGKGGVVYLQSGDRTNGFYLERVKLDVAK
jgi:hypothetical protein